jgi:hypothetical protein
MEKIITIQVDNEDGLESVKRFKVKICLQESGSGWIIEDDRLDQEIEAETVNLAISEYLKMAWLL